MPMIEVEPGVRLHVDDLVPRQVRATIVFLHGWPWSHRMFEHQRSTLPAEGVRTVCIDSRGFGLSDKPWDGLDYDTWARDVITVMERLDLRDVVLAGFSQGGAVAMHCAAMQPARLGKLVLMGAAGPVVAQKSDNPHGLPPQAFAGLLAALQADRAQANADFLKTVFATPVSEAFLRHVWSWGMEASPRATLRGIEELRDRDLRPGLGRIRVPTLVLHGRKDQVSPLAAGEAQAKYIPNARLEVFDNAGHGLFHDERERVNQALLRFALG